MKETSMSRFSPSMRKAGKALVLVAAMTIFTSCAAFTDEAELSTRSDLAGPEAQSIENFMRILLWITYAVFAAVLGATLWLSLIHI